MHISWWCLAVGTDNRLVVTPVRVWGKLQQGATFRFSIWGVTVALCFFNRTVDASDPRHHPM